MAVPAAAFTLPTGGAIVQEALAVAADPGSGLPAYCRVRGAITPAEAGDLPIMFQINLPDRWNLKTVQHGGGGLNGVLIEATGPFAGGRGVPPALARGYVTYGSDSGHQTPDRSFFGNPQAFANYSHEAVKRTKDLTSHVVKAYYGRDARRNYHIGGSKGGQEGLQAAQRYASDFDGVVAYYPAAQNQALQLAWNRLWHAAFNPPGGALNATEQALLKSAVLAACDHLDGLADGIVSNTTGCAGAFRVRELRCPDGVDAGDACLSDRQIRALETAAQPFGFAHPMPNGVNSVGPWPVFIGGDLETWFGTGVDGTQQAFYRSTSLRPEAARSTDIPEQAWREGVLATARIYDASQPDIDAFRARGGKLILVQGTTDMLVPIAMTSHYAEALARRYGPARVRDFVRYYLVPGYGHGGGAFTLSWDALAALDDWVEAGTPPRNPTGADLSAGGAGRQRPLCEAPAWPKYRGRGDPARADSFVCETR
ncbi:tannase/feruloyl esterase family alpha/beta hydrolase [Phenylobacterium sp.]|uniref:tannase/feruloyl esterase family alpha/beta hydrolase n=1 Tax=Phenylobacterium sp. TaxID=1871053 RepID=UPI00301C807C